MLKSRIKNKIDSKANWEKNNPILLAGELGVIQDTKAFKIGDGVTEFISLPTYNVSDDILSLFISNLNMELNEDGHLTVNLGK